MIGKVLVGLITAAVIWAGSSVVSLRERVSTVEADGRHERRSIDEMRTQLERIEEKVDVILLQLPASSQSRRARRVVRPEAP